MEEVMDPNSIGPVISLSVVTFHAQKGMALVRLWAILEIKAQVSASQSPVGEEMSGHVRRRFKNLLS